MKEVPFVRIKSRILLCEYTRRFLKAVRNEIVTSRQPFDYDSEYSVTPEVITFEFPSTEISKLDWQLTVPMPQKLDGETQRYMLLLVLSGVTQKKIDHGFFSRDDKMSLFSISKDTGSF